MASIERLVFEALATQLATLTWIKKIEYQNPRVLVSGFDETEIPAVQFWDTGEPFTHIKGHVEAEFGIQIELVMKSTDIDPVGQGDLFDRKDEIEQLFGSDPKLALNNGQIYHLRYDRADTDIFSTPPFLIAQLQFSALLNKPFSGC